MTRSLLVALALAPACRAGPETPARPSTAFLNVTVIDGTDGPPRPDQTVVVTGERIAAMGPRSSVKVPRGATIVDGAGKFLIPGLWDMHYHADNDTANQRRFMAMNVANGVVGVREMFGSAAVTDLKRKIEAGEVLGTRMVLGSAIVDGPNPYWPGSLVVGSPAEPDSVVALAKSQGAQFIKVYMMLPPAAFFAILRSARAQGLEVAGHVPYAVDPGMASDSGMRVMEHNYDVMFATATNRADLQRRAAKLLTSDRRAGFGVYNHLVAEAFANYDSAAAAELFTRFRTNGTWQVPTLAVTTGMGRLGKGDYAQDEAFRYMPEEMRKIWGGVRAFFPTWKQADWDALGAGAPGYLRMTGDLYRAGVRLLAGTDTPNPGTYPGFTLHRELELLVEAGLSPLAALQTATRNPADYLGASDSLGTVAEGKVGDLLLLDANPLDDIRNTRRIAGLLYRGTYRDRSVLDQLLPK
jgi:imidazolonepropionase-like amidohydrolase